MTKSPLSGTTPPFARKDVDEQAAERELGQWESNSSRTDRGDRLHQYGSGLPRGAHAGGGGDDPGRRAGDAAGRQGGQPSRRRGQAWGGGAPDRPRRR